jgi:hypothetical protein
MSARLRPARSTGAGAAVNNLRAATRLTSSRVLMDRMHAISCWKTEV